MNKINYSVKIESELVERVKACCEANNVSQTNLVQAALIHYLDGPTEIYSHVSEDNEFMQAASYGPNLVTQRDLMRIEAQGKLHEYFDSEGNVKPIRDLQGKGFFELHATWRAHWERGYQFGMDNQVNATDAKDHNDWVWFHGALAGKRMRQFLDSELS